VALWPTKFPQYCNGSKQSPINLDRFTARYKIIMPISFEDYDVVPTAQTLTNSGYTVAVTYTSARTPSISKGKLPDNGPYNLAQMHFHWGSDNSKGSEHTINSVRYPLELHLVHYKRQYGSLTQAIPYSDGLAVLGIMFEISENDNAALTPILNKFSKILTTAATTVETDLYAFSSLLPKDTSRFYRYSGGLTTPTCNEIVTWTVFDEPVPISKTQMALFRTLKDALTLPIQDNYRPPQPLNDRKVYRTFI